MADCETWAPGWPGIPARWTSSAKSGVGTALNRASRIWFTLSHGILNEVYYPRVDLACTRDCGLIVTDGAGFFSEEKRHTRQEISYLKEGVPAYLLTNTCLQNRFRIEKEVLTDPCRNTMLQMTRFIRLPAAPDGLRLFALLAPHLGNRGAGNYAWVGDYKGFPMIFAARDGMALAFACSVPWKHRSVGFVGVSDGWQELSRNKRLSRCYERAENGNLGLTGEIDWPAAPDQAFLVAIGFGRNAAEAGQAALASLQADFEETKAGYIREWEGWQSGVRQPVKRAAATRRLFNIGASVLRVHEAKDFPGGTIASLSVPWGFVKGDDDLGGYHLIWPRDLVEAAGGLLAAGRPEDCLGVLDYLRAVQEEDGHWTQNMWLDGTPYWKGIQMDETAFPILLANLLRNKAILSDEELRRYWPMVRKAAGFLVRNGPVAQQDRWEEDPGYSPFTLAVEIAALLAAADFADLNHEPGMAGVLRDTADIWNDNVERWIYARDTELSRRAGVEGYYVRIAPPEVADAASPLAGFVPIKNRPVGEGLMNPALIVSPDALALVRFGLRDARDPRVLNTVKVIDALLKVDTPRGPCWHRYNDDGYGEHEDGSPFDGTGTGRAWPLLAGERAHYELAAGNRREAESLAGTLEAFANEGGMISEQVWDSDDIPEKELFRGRPSGSAMPLVWAHAEYIKLIRSLEDGDIYDRPPQTVQRYVVEKRTSALVSWRFNQKRRDIPAGKTLRVEVLAPALVRWSGDGWATYRDAETSPTGLGMHCADLPTNGLNPGQAVEFTFFWPEGDRWEGTNFSLEVR
jgi:glucoamylase